MVKTKLNHGIDSMKVILYQNSKIWMMLEWNVFIIRVELKLIIVIEIIKPL